MKFWRTLAVATVALFVAASAFAAMTPKAPAAANGSSSGGPGGPGALVCDKDTTEVPTFPMVMCVEMQETTNTGVGNGFPWENSTFFFATYRNQYLFPTSTVDDVGKVTRTMDGIAARSVSFVGGSTNIYGGFSNGDPSVIRVTDAVDDTLVATFDANPLGGPICEIMGSSATPITLGTTTGPNGSTISTCESCSDPTYWCTPGEVRSGIRPFSRLMLDHLAQVAAGSGAGVWDSTSTHCTAVQRGYSSGSFVNPNMMTTAYGVDTYGFVWVFAGVAGPPPSTVQQQIVEIIRLLLTPEGMRCSGMDIVADDGLISEDPVIFPGGQDLDPLSPQVTTYGTKTGDETRDDLRKSGWMP